MLTRKSQSPLARRRGFEKGRGSGLPFAGCTPLNSLSAWALQPTKPQFFTICCVFYGGRRTSGGRSGVPHSRPRSRNVMTSLTHHDHVSIAIYRTGAHSRLLSPRNRNHCPINVNNLGRDCRVGYFPPCKLVWPPAAAFHLHCVTRERHKQ